MQDALFTAVKLPDRLKCLAGIYAALAGGASAANSSGWTALHNAARHNPDAEAVAAAIAALVAEGADVNCATSDGKLLTGCYKGCHNCWHCIGIGLEGNQLERREAAHGLDVHVAAHCKQRLHSCFCRRLVGVVRCQVLM